MAIPPYQINDVQDSQETAPGDRIVNTFVVTFTVPSLNSYTSQVEVPKVNGDTVAAVRTAIEAVISQVQAISALGG